MWVSRILFLIVITALGDLSRAGPHRRQILGLSCGDDCFREHGGHFPKAIPGEKYCTEVKEVVACLRGLCTKPEEIEIVDHNVGLIRSFLQREYLPCVL